MQKSSARAEGAVAKKHANVSAVAAEAANVFQVDFIFSSFFFCRPGGNRPQKIPQCTIAPRFTPAHLERGSTFDNDGYPHCSNAITWLCHVIISSLEATEIPVLALLHAVPSCAYIKAVSEKIIALARRVPREMQCAHS
jgi:hypothetical protein